MIMDNDALYRYLGNTISHEDIWIFYDECLHYFSLEIKEEAFNLIRDSKRVWSYYLHE